MTNVSILGCVHIKFQVCMLIRTKALVPVQVLTTGDNEELCYCLKAWQALPRNVQFGATPTKEEALKATAVVDRLRRGLADLSNRVVDRVSPISTAIGKSCGVESWAVDLFAEEVVRGGAAFAISLVLSAVEPALRRTADLGCWQIISPANVTGATHPCTYL